MMSSAATASTAPSASGRAGARPAASSARTLRERRQALPAQKHDAGDHAEKHEPQRRQHADRLADQDEAGDLRQDEGDDDQGNGNSHGRSCRCIWGGP